jgi:hypothetical protein
MIATIQRGDKRDWEDFVLCRSEELQAEILEKFPATWKEEEKLKSSSMPSQ